MRGATCWRGSMATTAKPASSCWTFCRPSMLPRSGMRSAPIWTMLARYLRMCRRAPTGGACATTPSMRSSTGSISRCHSNASLALATIAKTSERPGARYASLLRNSEAACAAFAVALWLISSPVAAQSDAVAAAFEAVRSGNLQSVAALRPVAADIPAVAAYLRDRDESLRREAVVVLARLGHPACPALVAGLTDASADMRARAARAIYRTCSAATADVPGLAAALQQSVRMGNASAAPLLLLGRFSNDETRSFFRGLLA